jgi:hypothetical protein
MVVKRLALTWRFSQTNRISMVVELPVSEERATVPL